MPDVERITHISQFDLGWWLDWLENPALTPNLAMVCPIPDDLPAWHRNTFAGGPLGANVSYALQQTTVTVTAKGPDGERRICNDADLQCNHMAGDGLLVAARSGGAGGAADAPLRLTFSNPVRAVGCHISGSPAVPANALFDVLLWARLAGRAAFEPAVATRGRTGLPVLPPIARKAPFLGVRSLCAELIEEVRFDLVPVATDKVDRIALGTLLVLS